jgi:uncharacterized protein YndB with AHSA1/START domain
VVRVELMVEIARPPDEVFDYLTDTKKLPEWQASAVESRADGPLAEGSRIVERRSLFGREAETELEVTCYEPGRRLSLRSVSGPLNFSIDHLLDGIEGATRLHVTAAARPAGLLRFAKPALASRARQELRRDFERLKEILESIEE